MITIATIHATTNPTPDLCHPQCGQFSAVSLSSFRHSGQLESATGAVWAKWKFPVKFNTNVLERGYRTKLFPLEERGWGENVVSPNYTRSLGIPPCLRMPEFGAKKMNFNCLQCV
jgi:hypothetical protein